MILSLAAASSASAMVFLLLLMLVLSLVAALRTLICNKNTVYYSSSTGAPALLKVASAGLGPLDFCMSICFSQLTAHIPGHQRASTI